MTIIIVKFVYLLILIYSFYMKYILLLLVLFVTIISSCGDDSTTTPTDPPSNVLFSMDTIAAVREPGFIGSSTVSQSFNNTVSGTQVKVEYRIQSNIDTSLNQCSGTYTDSTNGSPSSPNTINLYGAIDSAYSFTYTMPTQPFYAGFKVRLIVNSAQSVQRYVRFVNVKVTKVN